MNFSVAVHLKDSRTRYSSLSSFDLLTVVVSPFVLICTEKHAIILDKSNVKLTSLVKRMINLNA